MEKLVGKYRKAKGFTLVELLVVIIIIGILAGMMMLSTGAATDKAEATKIVSDMRNIKSACLMFYADRDVWPASGDANLSKYVDQDLTKSRYAVVSTDNNGGLAVVTSNDTAPTKLTAGVKAKLKAMASDAGLYSTIGATNTVYNGTDDKVYMIIKKNN